MAAQLHTHPSPDDLRGFALGKLDERTASIIINHLDGCPDCCRVAAAQSGDDFLDRLRQAHSLSGTPAPAESTACAAPKLAASPPNRRQRQELLLGVLCPWIPTTEMSEGRTHPSGTSAALRRFLALNR
jgi:hypothetical protein